MDKEKTAASIGKLLGKKLLKDKSGTQKTSSTSEVDVCAAALKAAETGVKMTTTSDSATNEGTTQTTPQKLIEDVKKNPEKLLEDVAKDPKKALKSLKGLFNR